MALSHLKLIQSLGDAMAWLNREKEWGVPATELRHLCGRIGELYAAVITNGQMAPETNQRGYDVVAASGERISVKTTAMTGSAGHITFNATTLKEADRFMIFRIDTVEEQIETLFNGTFEELEPLLHTTADGSHSLSLSKVSSAHARQQKLDRPLSKVAEVSYEGYTIRELENGTIEVMLGDELVTPVLPKLRELAMKLNLSVLNSQGNPYNTRSLGTQVIKAVTETQKNTL